MSAKLSPLIAGATIAQEHVVRQLLVYGAQVFLYRPAEEEGPPLLAAELDDLCLAYAPVPFGAGLVSFQALIKDMTRYRAEYYGAGLSALSAKTAAVDQESVWRLIRRLHPRPTAEAEPPDETLLQARLLLKLAELQEQEEKEIAQALALVEGKGLTLLHGLTSEGDEEEFADLTARPAALSAPPAGPRPDRLDARLRAWAHLFLHDPRRAEHWLLAASPEVFELLAEYGSPGLGDGPQPLLSLPLPGPALLALAPAAYRMARQRWQAAQAAPLQGLSDGLRTVAAGEPVDLAPIAAALGQAPHSGEPLWAEAQAGSRLDLYRLPLSLPALMAKIAKQPIPEPQNENRHSLPYGVVAVPRPTS